MILRVVLYPVGSLMDLRQHSAGQPPDDEERRLDHRQHAGADKQRRGAT